MPKRWPADLRDQAVKLAVASGLPVASEATGVPRTTIHGWLKERGLTAYSEQSDREKTAAARTAAELARERWASARLQLLTEVSVRGLEATARRLSAGAVDEPLHGIVGAWTRSEHHLERMAAAAAGASPEGRGQVVVNFNVGRSGTAGPPVVAEASLGAS